MEIITREIVKMREDAPVKYLFKTYDLIFNPKKAEDSGFHPNFCAMLYHLQNVMLEGLPCRPKSPSGAERLMIESVQVKPDSEHYELVKMAVEADYRGAKYWQHRRVQNLVFEKHPDCFAIEFPIHDDEWCGLGDILLMNPHTGSIVVWDFKPDAHQDKDAPQQVFRYRKLIQKLLIQFPKTDITLVVGGYFDDRNAYLIK